MVGPPKVINKTVNGKTLEPFEVIPRATKWSNEHIHISYYLYSKRKYPMNGLCRLLL